MSILKDLKKYNRKLYEQLEAEGASSAFKSHPVTQEANPAKIKMPKFAKLKGMLGK